MENGSLRPSGLSPEEPAAQLDRPRAWPWLGLCLAVALAARLLALALFHDVPVPRESDSFYYVAQAQSLLAGEGHPGSFRPPGYPAFLSIALAVSEDLTWVRLCQIGVALVGILLVFQIVAPRFGNRAAFLSALACALEPSLVHYSHFLWSECLATTGVVLVFWALERFDRTSRSRHLVLAGLALGLLSLVREQWLYFAPLVVGWLAWRSAWQPAASLGKIALFATCVAAVILPWSVRNTLLHGDFVLVSTCRWFPIAIGNTLPEEGLLFGARPPSRNAFLRAHPGIGEPEEEAHWRDVALASIRAEQPWWIFKKTLRNTSHLFSLRTKQLYYVSATSRVPGQGQVPVLEDPGRPVLYGLIVSDVLGYVTFMLLGLSALWIVPDPRLKVLVAGALLFTLAVHVFAVSVTRFRIPILPLIGLYIGPLLTVRRSPSQPWRKIGALVTVLLFAALILTRWQVDLGPALERAARP